MGCFRSTAYDRRRSAPSRRRDGAVAVLHTWEQNRHRHHHPRLHCVVRGGGISFDHSRWIPCRRDFFLPVRTLCRCFREIFLRQLERAFEAGTLRFATSIAERATQEAFATRLANLRQTEWVVFAEPPVANPQARPVPPRPLYPSHRHRKLPPCRTLRVHPAIPSSHRCRRFHRTRHLGFLANGIRLAAMLPVGCRRYTKAPRLSRLSP